MASVKKNEILPCPVCSGKKAIGSEQQHGSEEDSINLFPELFFYRVDEEPPTPPRVPTGRLVPFRKLENGGSEEYWIAKIHYRFEYTGKWTADVHWWPTHGLMVNATNLSPADMNLFSKVLKKFKPETRGGVKVTDERVKQAVSIIGPGATQVGAAKVLGVSESAVEYWRRKRKIKSWQDVVTHFSRSL